MSAIRLALFCGESHPARERVEAVLRQRIGEHFQIYRTLEVLDRGFRRPGHATHILVLCPGTGGELLGLVRMRHLLMNVRVLLILPNRAGENIAQGHTLYPRYISYVDGDFSDVAAVLDKMLQNEKTGAAGSSGPLH